MSSSLRIIHDNAADRATITASTTAGSLVAANVKTDIKTEVHRATGTSVTFTLAWTEFENFGGLFIPVCNYSPDATMRLRVYDATSGGTLLADTGVQYCCPGQNLVLWDWSDHLNVPVAIDANAFAYGGFAKAGLWMDDTYAIKRVVVDISDPLNDTNLDTARIVCGGYWQPEYNAAYGAELSLVDRTNTERLDSGDLVSDRSTRHERGQMNLQYMKEADRARFIRILRGNGKARFVLLSLVPESEDPVLEQDNLLYGSMGDSGTSFDFYNAHSGPITIEGW